MLAWCSSSMPSALRAGESARRACSASRSARFDAEKRTLFRAATSECRDAFGCTRIETPLTFGRSFARKTPRLSANSLSLAAVAGFAASSTSLPSLRLAACTSGPSSGARNSLHSLESSRISRAFSRTGCISPSADSTRSILGRCTGTEDRRGQTCRLSSSRAGWQRREPSRCPRRSSSRTWGWRSRWSSG